MRTNKLIIPFVILLGISMILIAMVLLLGNTPELTGAIPAQAHSNQQRTTQLQSLPRIEFEEYEEVPEDGARNPQPEEQEVERQGDTPFSITISGIEIADIPVVEVGLEPDMSMEIPHNIHEIGWYTPLNIRPGDPGNAVMAGHVDSRVQGRGAFFNLSQLESGDTIELGTSSSTQYWQVTSVTNYDKDYLPIDEVFATEGDPTLVLVTCGGPFDSDTRNYLENTVVMAELVEIS